jgi:hypothetical protein
VFDWEAFAIAFGAVGIAAMFACLTPAMTAMLIEPLKALKEWLGANWRYGFKRVYSGKVLIVRRHTVLAISSTETSAVLRSAVTVLSSLPKLKPTYGADTEKYIAKQESRGSGPREPGYRAGLTGHE